MDAVCGGEGGEGVVEEDGAVAEDTDACGAVAVAAVDVDGGVLGEEGDPGWGPVVFVEVGEDDGVGEGLLEADGAEDFAGAAGGEAQVDEDAAAVGVVDPREDGAVSAGAAGEDAEAGGLLLDHSPVSSSPWPRP